MLYPMRKSSINIVTPSFNQAKFIDITIKSVLAQKDSQLHYWVIDGGSKDGTVKILRSYGHRLKWISEKDLGQANAINKGIKKLFSRVKKEDIFAYINSDDYYLPGAFDEVRKAFHKHPEAMWLVGEALIVGENGQEIHSWIKLYKQILRHFPFMLYITNPLPQPSVFIRANAIKRMGLFDEKLHFTMDYDYWFRLYRHYGKPFVLDQTLSAFRVHSTSKGGSQFQKQFLEEYLVMQKYVSNPILRFFHKAHTYLIFLVYSLIK